MWIDTRNGTIKVYEKQPSDPWVKKLTWISYENAWCLDAEPETPLMTIAKELGDPVQIKAAKDWEAGKLSYAEMRGLMG